MSGCCTGGSPPMQLPAGDTKGERCFNSSSLTIYQLNRWWKQKSHILGSGSSHPKKSCKECTLTRQHLFTTSWSADRAAVLALLSFLAKGVNSYPWKRVSYCSV